METEGNRFGRPSKWKQSGGGSKERSQRDMFPPPRFLFSPRPWNKFLPLCTVFCRWRETATLKFYPLDNASESAAIQFEKTANPRPRPVRGQYPAGFARYTPFNLSILFFKFLLSWARERERGNTNTTNTKLAPLSKGFEACG